MVYLLARPVLNMYMADIKAIFGNINWTLHIYSHFMIILVQSQLKLFFQKKNMLINLHILVYHVMQTNLTHLTAVLINLYRWLLSRFPKILSVIDLLTKMSGTSLSFNSLK